MKLHEIEAFEKTFTRDQLDEFDKYMADLQYDLVGRRGYDADFMYSKFYEMNTRTAIYLGYVMGLKKAKDVE